MPIASGGKPRRSNFQLFPVEKMALIGLILFYLIFPAVIVYSCQKNTLLEKMGPVVLSYIVGFAIGNAGLLPAGAEKVQNLIATATIPIALPLLLFSMDVKKWTRVAGKAMLAMILAMIAVVVVVFLGYTWYRGQIHDAWKVGGMLVGVYTGGTPNLAAIKTALQVDANTYIIVHTYDTILSTVYILFFITVAQKIFSTILPPYKFAGANGSQKEGSKYDEEDIHSYAGFFRKKTALPLLKALGLAVFIFAVGGALSLVVPKSFSMTMAILAITTLGILFSFVPSVRRIEKTFQLGMYFILIFCLDVASMASIQRLAGTSHDLFFYVFLAIFGSLLLHVIASSFFKIDADTVIITSTAMICSPPFVPVVAAGLKNKEIILTGLTTGVVGYAVGNYLGIFVAYLLR